MFFSNLIPNGVKPLLRWFLFLMALLVSGCQSRFGPSSLLNTHPAYNQALTQSLNEQMLLNLVRLRYRDRFYFLKVNSVTASMAFNSNLGVDSEFDLGPSGNILSPNLGMGYSDRPTISYQPLQGEDFLKNIMAAIPFDAILAMTQSGWSIERIFAVSIERVNNLFNAPSASGPTPNTAPEFEKFKMAIQILRQLQLNNQIEIGLDQDKKPSLMFKKDPATQEQVNQLLKLMDVTQDKEADYEIVRIKNDFLTQHENILSIRTRSIISILFYLSQMVQVPEPHVEAGFVTQTRTSQGVNFDWKQTPLGPYFDIQYSKEYPKNAYIAVSYRGYWFYISDTDLESKSTFLLVLQLFNLQAGQSKLSGPTLTLPVF